MLDSLCRIIDPDDNCAQSHKLNSALPFKLLNYFMVDILIKNQNIYYINQLLAKLVYQKKKVMW